MFKIIRNFFEKEMWLTPYQSLVGIRGLFSKIIRITYLTIRGFSQDQCIMRAASLTYYSVMALVPALALAFAVAQWLNLKEYLESQLYIRFSDQKNILDVLFSFANNLLDRTRGSVLAIFGFIFIFWALVKMLSYLENALNAIWQIKKKRSFYKKIRDYFFIMLVGPIFFLLSLSATFFIVSWLHEFIQGLPFANALSPTTVFLLKMAPYGVVWLLFILLYFLMPSQRVPIKPTLFGALIGGTGYQIVQWGFITFQIGVTKASAIYGSFVFLPLFMIWMQLSWTIFLVGAEIGFAVHHVKTYESEKKRGVLSFRKRKLLSLWILVKSIQETEDSKGLTRDKILSVFSLSSDLVNHLLDNLVELHLLLKIRKIENEFYIPTASFKKLSFLDVFNQLEEKYAPTLSEDELYGSLEIILEDLDMEMQKSPHNKSIMLFASKKL